MNQFGKGVLFMVMLALVSINQVQAAGYTFSTIDITGAQETIAMGINDAGQIVGTYGSNLINGQTPQIAHGFVFQNGNPMTYDVAGAETTWAYGINNAGKFVGEYLQGGYHPFLHDAGGFNPLNIPGAVEGNAHGINSLDWIAGHYSSDNSGAFHGFLKVGINITGLNVVAAWSTSATGINGDGLVVGEYRNSSDGPRHGFTYDAQTMAYGLLDFPGGSETRPHGISQDGHIVGSYISDSESQGFIFFQGKFSSLNFPGAAGTLATGINNAGQIVGGYIGTDGSLHGFVASSSKALNSTLQLLLD